MCLIFGCAWRLVLAGYLLTTVTQRTEEQHKRYIIEKKDRQTVK